MYLPNYEKTASSFVLNEIYASQKMKNYSYSWRESFKKDVIEERKISAIVFTYVDGKYIILTSDSYLIQTVNDYADGQILTIDGKKD